MDLIYLAHPVAPLPGSTETVKGNLDDAEWWLTALQRANEDVAIIAPWIPEIRLGISVDSDPESRRRGLARCRAAAARCHEIILCGPRISRGMLHELEAYRSRSAPWVVHRFLHREQCLDLGVTRCQANLNDLESFPSFFPWTWFPSFFLWTWFGAFRQSAEVVAHEILDAERRYAEARQ